TLPHLGGKLIESFACPGNHLICRFPGLQNTGAGTPHPFASHTIPVRLFRSHTQTVQPLRQHIPQPSRYALSGSSAGLKKPVVLATHTTTSINQPTNERRMNN